MNLYVWYEPEPISDEQAHTKYLDYSSGDFASFRRHPAVVTLYDEVLQAFPVGEPGGRRPTGGVWDEPPEPPDVVAEFHLCGQPAAVDVMLMIIERSCKLGLVCFDADNGMLLEMEDD